MYNYLVLFINKIIEIFSLNPFGQILGLIAFIISIYNFGFCKDKKFIFFTMIVSIFWGFHFLSLGLLSAAYINIVDILKNLFALKYDKNKYITLLFIIIYIIISFFSYNGIISLIPLLTAISSTILVFYIRGIYLNLGFLFIILLWMIYNYLGNSIGGLSTDITLMISGVFGIMRMIIKNKKNKFIKKEKEIIESIN